MRKNKGVGATAPTPFAVQHSPSKFQTKILGLLYKNRQIFYPRDDILTLFVFSSVVRKSQQTNSLLAHLYIGSYDGKRVAIIFIHTRSFRLSCPNPESQREMEADSDI